MVHLPYTELVKIPLRVSVVLGFAIMSVSQTSLCWACSCAEGTTEAENYELADAVFVGVVLERQPTNYSDDPHAEVIWTLDVESVSKGQVSDPQQVKTTQSDSLCGYSFSIGERYKV